MPALRPPVDLDPAAADARAAGFDPAKLARLRGVFERLVDGGRLPGAVMLVARRGRLACFERVGLRAPLAADAMPHDAIFRIYSMTKPIVSMALMRLFERGEVRLDTPVAHYLPEFASTKLGIERDGRLELVTPARAMTVQDLLRHTAGFTYEFLAPSLVRQRYAEARIFSRDLDNAAFVTRLANLPLMHEPGTVFDYSRSTDVVGRLIEVLTGQGLAAHLDEAVFRPLGMADTGFYVPADRQARIAEGHAIDPDTGAPAAFIDVCRPAPRVSGGGGLVSTAADYARFLDLLEGGGRRGDVRLLGRKTVEFMTADHLGELPNVCELLPPGHGFGLGVAVRLQTGVGTMPGSAGTYGWGGLAGTVFFVDPVESLFAVMMVQAPGQSAELGSLFRNLVYAALDDA